jgi:CHAD domain-containing protein
LPGAELQRLAAKLGNVAKGLETDDRGRAATRGWRWAIDARVRHRAEALKGAVDAAGNVYLAGRLHAVRITLKKFRYAVELKDEVSPDRTGTHDLASLKRTQGLLGRLHDRQVLIDRVRQVQASLTRPNLAIWRALDALLNALETECRRLHARYVRDAVGLVALCDRVTGRAVDAPARQRAV